MWTPTRGIAIDNRPYSTFETGDFLPFEAGIAAEAESILVSHNMVQCMESGVPASLSPVVHRILRNTIRFTGVIMTDDLSMDGVVDYAKYRRNESGGADGACWQRSIAFNQLFRRIQCGFGGGRNGTIPKIMIDHAVFRILAWKYAKGDAKLNYPLYVPISVAISFTAWSKSPTITFKQVASLWLRGNP